MEEERAELDCLKWALFHELRDDPGFMGIGLGAGIVHIHVATEAAAARLRAVVGDRRARVMVVGGRWKRV